MQIDNLGDVPLSGALKSCNITDDQYYETMTNIQKNCQSFIKKIL